MQAIKILIVEDDILSATKLEMALQELGYEVTQIASNVPEAVRCIRATDPDILIVDIFLQNDETGIQLAQKIGDDQLLNRPIIFLTSSEDKETFSEAKKTAPCAFLLKPFDIKSLQHAIELAFASFCKEIMPSLDEQAASFVYNKDLFIKKEKKLVKIAINDVKYIEVEAKYSMLFCQDSSFLIRISLKKLLNVFPDNTFVRIHRNYLINSDSISEIDLENDTVLVNGTSLPMGKIYKKQLTSHIPYLK